MVVLGIGFDSGGTHTTYALEREDGPLPVFANEAASSISSARDNRSSDAAIRWIVERIAAQPDDEICAWIGAAGFSAATARDIAQRFQPHVERLTELFDAENRQCDIFLTNDAVAILKAPPLLGTGVAAIVGTGSVVMGAHPSCPAGVIRRGGYEWVVSDEGSGIWMTLQCVRLLLEDIQVRGSENYHSALLDRLADFLSISDEEVEGVAASHRAMAKADLIARKISESRSDAKRFLASFVYPDVFDLAVLQPGRSHDPIAAEVLSTSVSVITENIRVVSDTLAAHTADAPNLRQPLPLVVGGNIAANPMYDQRLRAEISSTCRFVSSVEAIGDAAKRLASLALYYRRCPDRAKRAIARSFDPLHPVLKVM